MAKARPAQITNELNDVWGLVVGYTKQETTAPLRGLGSFMKWGAIAMVLYAFGTLFGTLAVVRALQSETGSALTGYWSWVPYAGAVVFVGIVGFLSVRSLARTPWKQKGGAQ